jgi:hypothetical protein
MTIAPNRAIGFALDEDEALKMKLENYGRPFTVINYANLKEIPIAVYYRSPDVEIRKRTFPHIAIDLIDIEPDHERMHRCEGMVVPMPIESPTGLITEEPRSAIYWADDFPFPWMLIYQLSAISRDPTHDRQLAQLLYHMFPYQFGQLDTSMFDGTIRRADLRGTTRRDLPADQTNKRIFRQIFTIAVSSEFYVDEIMQIPLVSSVDVVVEEWFKQDTGAGSELP